MGSPIWTQPQLSGMVLAGGARLTVRDLMDPDGPHFEHLKLVVLSACQTGLHGVDLPDEVVGLPASWLQAGAATVVASLWPVSDRATLALMTKFYEICLVDRLEPRTALWLAQRWLRGLPSWREDFKRAGLTRAAQGSDIAEDRQSATAVDRSSQKKAAERKRERRWDSPVYWAAFVAYGR